MTAYKARSSGKFPKSNNKKDGATSRRSTSQNWEGHGFSQVDWNAHIYTWKGNFPVFRIAPGIHGSAGLIARCDEADKAIYFPYGTAPAIIAKHLDDEIEEMIHHQACEVAAEIDFDRYMADLQAGIDEECQEAW